MTVEVKDIKFHYDLISIFYHIFWGEHIHHGYWQGSEDQYQAQLNLIQLLYERSGLKPGMKVLDIGCGLGGSSLWLAGKQGCEVKGITVSPIQAKIANYKAKKRNIDSATTFQLKDANNLSGIDKSFDCVWIIECSEHISDKNKFFGQCYSLLRPGGKLALCSWLRGGRALEETELLREIYDAMLCPGFLSGAEVVDILAENDFCKVEFEDITSRVKQTWDICIEISKRASVRMLLPVMGQRVHRFVESFELMKKAFDNNLMEYGMVTAKKQS